MDDRRSDRRPQPSRDDRRRGDRDDDRRRGSRRSRSPPHRPRRDFGVDSYSSGRDFREREREDRYGGRDRRDREWDRDRGSARRDARRGDEDDDRRRDARRNDRDSFDDRRRPPREDPRDRDRERDRDRDRDRDRARDRDDMRQMERQTRQRSPSPPPKKTKEPTPDLTDVVSAITRKRRLTQWDIKPPGYENVTGEQAKLSGMFPLPGAPRQQPMDPTRLQAFMNQPGNQASGAALKPATARQSKRLIALNLPGFATNDVILDFFNLQLNGLNVTRGADPCVSAHVSQDNTYALLEFKTPEDATNAMALNGITMEEDEPMNGDANGSGHHGLQIRRPKEYIVPSVANAESETDNSALNSDIVPDTQDKIAVTNIPIYLDEDNIKELLLSFGELKTFAVAKDRGSEQLRGFAFCEYVDVKITDVAVSSLDGMEIGEGRLKVSRACVGIQQVGGEMSVGAMSMMAGSKSGDSAEGGRVLCLMNMITPQELMRKDEAAEILEDVKEECEKYGRLVDVKMPLPGTVAARAMNGIGKIYLKYEEAASAARALQALAGRRFADRTVVVTYFGEEYFDVEAW